jgi:hypothetical protein
MEGLFFAHKYLQQNHNKLPSYKKLVMKLQIP